MEIKSILFDLFIKGLILLQLFFDYLNVLLNVLLLRIMVSFEQCSKHVDRSIVAYVHTVRHYYVPAVFIERPCLSVAAGTFVTVTS